MKTSLDQSFLWSVSSSFCKTIYANQPQCKPATRARRAYCSLSIDYQRAKKRGPFFWSEKRKSKPKLLPWIWQNDMDPLKKSFDNLRELERVYLEKLTMKQRLQHLETSLIKKLENTPPPIMQ